MDILRVLSLLFKSKTEAAKSAVSRLVVLLIIFSIALLIAVMGLAFLLFSSYLYLVTIFSPFIAALITGGGAILLGVLIVLAGVLITGGEKKEKKVEGFQNFLGSKDLGTASEFINEHPFESGLSAAVLGFIAGSSPDVRQTITQLLIEIKQAQRMN